MVTAWRMRTELDMEIAQRILSVPSTEISARFLIMAPEIRIYIILNHRIYLNKILKPLGILHT